MVSAQSESGPAPPLALRLDLEDAVVVDCAAEGEVMQGGAQKVQAILGALRVDRPLDHQSNNGRGTGECATLIRPVSVDKSSAP